MEGIVSRGDEMRKDVENDSKGSLALSRTVLLSLECISRKQKKKNNPLNQPQSLQRLLPHRMAHRGRERASRSHI